MQIKTQTVLTLESSLFGIHVTPDCGPRLSRLSSKGSEKNACFDYPSMIALSLFTRCVEPVLGVLVT